MILVNKKLLTGTVLVNNLFLIDNQMFIYIPCDKYNKEKSEREDNPLKTWEINPKNFGCSAISMLKNALKSTPNTMYVEATFPIPL